MKKILSFGIVFLSVLNMCHARLLDTIKQKAAQVSQKISDTISNTKEHVVVGYRRFTWKGSQEEAQMKRDREACEKEIARLGSEMLAVKKEQARLQHEKDHLLKDLQRRINEHTQRAVEMQTDREEFAHNNGERIHERNFKHSIKKVEDAFEDLKQDAVRLTGLLDQQERLIANHYFQLHNEKDAAFARLEGERETKRKELQEIDKRKEKYVFA